MALGYEIGTIMKRTSTSYSDDKVTIKLDDIEGIDHTFSQARSRAARIPTSDHTDVHCWSTRETKQRRIVRCAICRALVDESASCWLCRFRAKSATLWLRSASN